MGPTRLALLVAVLLVAVAGPLLAYSMYPRGIPRGVLTGNNVAGEKPQGAPLFVEALRHSHYYRGFRGVSGVVVAAFPHGVIMKGAHGERVIVVLPRCVLVGGKPLPLWLVAEKLLGKHVVVIGHVFWTPHGLVVKPRVIRVDERLVVIRPCHHHVLSPRHWPPHR